MVVMSAFFAAISVFGLAAAFTKAILTMCKPPVPRPSKRAVNKLVDEIHEYLEAGK